MYVCTLLNGREECTISQGADSSERCTACEVVPQVQYACSEAEKQTGEEQSRRGREAEKEKCAVMQLIN